MVSLHPPLAPRVGGDSGNEVESVFKLHSVVDFLSAFTGFMKNAVYIFKSPLKLTLLNDSK